MAKPTPDMFGQEVVVTLSEYEPDKVVTRGVLLSWSDMGEVILSGDDGDIHHCWPMLHIELAPGTPYTFWRKYLWPPRKPPLADVRLEQRARAEALRIARMFGIDWAARIDMIHERARDRLVFLECDAAPLIGPASAFALSLTAGGMAREIQLRRLLSVDALATRPAHA